MILNQVLQVHFERDKSRESLKKTCLVTGVFCTLQTADSMASPTISSSPPSYGTAVFEDANQRSELSAMESAQVAGLNSDAFNMEQSQPVTSSILLTVAKVFAGLYLAYRIAVISLIFFSVNEVTLVQFFPSIVGICACILTLRAGLRKKQTGLKGWISALVFWSVDIAFNIGMGIRYLPIPYFIHVFVDAVFFVIVAVRNIKENNN